MQSTSPSLLRRLREPDNQAAWGRFVDLYTPLLFYWARKTGLQEQDAADLVQDVFALLLEKLPSFEYRPRDGIGGQFRAWLRTVMMNKWRERNRRKRAESLEPADPRWGELASADGVDDFWREEHDRFLVARALEIMQGAFEPTSWKACWETTVQGRKVADVANELGMSEGAVYVARSRVLARLREELVGLLDD